MVMSENDTERPKWEHLGNPWCSAEEFRCTGCDRVRYISNRSDRFQEAGEPDPCGCSVDADVEVIGADD